MLHFQYDISFSKVRIFGQRWRFYSRKTKKNTANSKKKQKK